MKRKTRTLTRGHAELARLVAGGLEQRELAEACGKSEATASRWVSGERSPDAASEAVLERRWGIARAWWREPSPALQSPAPAPAPATPTAAAATPSTEGKTETARARAERYATRVDELLHVIASTTASAEERQRAAGELRALRTAMRGLEALGKITGETRAITEPAIVRTPAWERLCAVIVTAICPWPTKDAIEALTGDERIAANACREAVLRVGHALRDFDEATR